MARRQSYSVAYKHDGGRFGESNRKNSRSMRIWSYAICAISLGLAIVAVAASHFAT